MTCARAWRRWPAVLAIVCGALIGSLAAGCDSTRCTGLKTYDVVDDDKVPWARTTVHGRCDDGDFCVMEDGMPQCVPWWSALGRHPLFLGTAALLLLTSVVLVVRRRRRRAAASAPAHDAWQSRRER